MVVDPEETVFGDRIIFDEGALLALPCLAGIGELGGEPLLDGGADGVSLTDQGIRGFGLCGIGRERRGQKQGERDTGK